MTGSSRFRDLIGSACRVGLGGEGILRTQGREKEAQMMLAAACEGGIRYFDSSPAYAGSERYLGSFWRAHPERVKDTFQTSKSAQRDARGASGDLARSLSLLARDHLGLWQIHDVRDAGDIRSLEDDDGALRAFYDARETGIVRGIGVTGHHDPAILLHSVTEWDIDSVLLPVSPVETALGGFSDRVTAAAREQGVGVIGMKVLGAGTYLSPGPGMLAENLIRYALSQDVDMVIAGCSTPGEALHLARLGREHNGMEEEEQARMVEAVRPYAERLAYYRGVI